MSLFSKLGILVKNIRNRLRTFQVLTFLVNIRFERSGGVSDLTFLPLSESRSGPFFIIESIMNSHPRSFGPFKYLLRLFINQRPGIHDTLLLLRLLLSQVLEHPLPLLLSFLLVLHKLLGRP